MRNIGYGIVSIGALAGLVLFSMAALNEPLAMGTALLRTNKLKGYDATQTGLFPVYPEGFECSPLTSLYASWVDVDGTEREEIHTGVDGGRAGDVIYAPAPGEVVRAWVSNWGWGTEGSLLIRHSRDDLNLGAGQAPFYYSEFDHLNYKDVKSFKPGQHIKRGQQLAKVWYPGGKKRYLPEVHWEVWEVRDDSRTKWKRNRFKRLTWKNPSATLIDPLYMLAQQVPPNEVGGVFIQPFLSGRDYTEFSGFTYILPCRPIK